jgi:hypothetical protein
VSDLAIDRDTRGDATFRVTTVAAMVVIGVIGFIGMMVLGAYGPDLKSGRNGGAHALSSAATGFSGLVQLADATGRHPSIIRSDHGFGGDNLLVVTPPSGSTPMGPILDSRLNVPTLVILPKWTTEADPKHAGWVRAKSLVDESEPRRVLAPSTVYTVHRAPSHGVALVVESDLPPEIAFHAPRPLQTIAGDKLIPLISDAAGNLVLAQVPGKPLYILADPDLLSNRGLRDVRQAEAALALLDWLNATDAKGIDFDVTLNGFGRSRSLLKLALEPPALAMTLTIAVAALLVAIHALGRFGAPVRRQRTIAFGKRALVDNAAAMVRMARRETSLGPRYVQIMRERARRAFGMPPRLKDDALDAALDRISRRARFSALSAAVNQATDRTSLLAAAEALHEWQEGMKV